MIGTDQQDDDAPRPAAPPVSGGRETVLVLFLVLLSGALTLYRTADRDLFTAHEARAARVARHMLDSAAWPAEVPNPWLVPQFSPEVDPALNYQKPPLYYWAVAAASAVRGDVTNLTVRLPSAISLVVLVVVTFYLCKALVSVRTGFIAALVLVSTPKILWWSRAAILDPMLAACVAGALLFFYRAHRGIGGRWQYWLFWGLTGLGMLVKATSLVVPLLTVGGYLLMRARAEGFWGPLWRPRPVSGLLVLLAVAAPWHVAADVATGGHVVGWNLAGLTLPGWQAGDFSRVYWGMHVFGRATGTSVFEDNTYWWYYFPVMVRDLFPWIVFLPGALVQPWRRASRDDRAGLLLPGAWFVGSLVFFSAVSFRKDEYMLVASPGAALLIGYLLDYYLAAHRQDPALRKWIQAAFTILAVGAFLLGAGLLSVALWPSLQQRLLETFHNRTDQATFRAVADLMAERLWLAVLLAGPIIVGSVASVVLVRQDRPVPTVTLTVCTMILSFVLFVETVVPVLGEARGLASFATVVVEEVKRHRPVSHIFLAVEECHELAFLLHRNYVGLAAQPDLVGHLKGELAAGQPWLVVMERKAYEGGRGADPALGWRVVGETPARHRQPMVLLEPTLKPKGPGGP